MTDRTFAAFVARLIETAPPAELILLAAARERMFTDKDRA